MSIAVDGFYPENLERIYVGEPAVVGRRERLPVDVLSESEYEVAELAATGMTYNEISARLYRGVSTVRTHLHHSYMRLGIASKYGLVAYFPIDPEDIVLEGKTLSQHAPKPLEVLEGVSQGKVYKTIAAEMDISRSTVRTHMFNVSGKWQDCKNPTAALRIANGIRARYARKVIESGKSVSERLDDFALFNLVDCEPAIRKLLLSAESDNTGTPAVAV